MKNKLILLFFTFITVINANAQLTKKYWLIGGNGSFKTYKSNESFTNQSTGVYNEIQKRNRQFDAVPKIGYFILDKFAIGLIASFSSETSESKTITGDSSGGSSKSYKFYAGPFVRYYFLNEEKSYNLLAEMNYQYGFLNSGDIDFITKEGGKISKFNLLFGPEIFLNSSTGLEFLIGYDYNKIKMDNKNAVSTNNSGFFFAIGFQLHLEKR